MSRRLIAVLFWLALLPAGAESPRGFESTGWAGQQEAVQAILSRLPAETRVHAAGYLEQVNSLTPSIQQPEVLRKFCAARKAWARAGPAMVSRLAPFLQSDKPWERFQAAMLLGGTHSPEAITVLKARAEVESHLDVSHALQAALAELGDRTVERVRSLVAAQRAERDRGREMAASGGYDARARRAPEIRCCHLIELVCNVHRPEVVPLQKKLAGDDGALGETHRAAEFYLLADLDLLTPAQRRRYKLISGAPRVVTKSFRRSEQNGLAQRLLRYPQLRGMKDVAIQSRINEELRLAIEPATLPLLSPIDGVYDQERTFRVGRLDDRYLSVRYTGWGRHRGNSSVDHFCAARTIELKTGRVLELSDLFWPGRDYLTRLKTLATPAVTEWMGTDPGPDFFRRSPGFYLTPEKLVLFDLLGLNHDLDIPIRLADLEDLALPQGPLRR